MAKKPNYSFNKNMKAQKRAQKQEEKRLRKIENARLNREQSPPDAEGEGADGDDAGAEE